MAPKRKRGETNKKTKAKKKARVVAPASPPQHNSDGALQFPADFPLEILQQVVSELDDISATCFALTNMRCMDALKAHKNAESKKEPRERRAAQSGRQISSSNNNGADNSATNSDLPTVIAPPFKPPQMASMLDQHTETDGRSWGLPALLQNWMPDDYALNYWEYKFMPRRALREYAHDWTEEQKGILEEEKEAREARREERREAKYDRQEERAERHAEVRARKETEFEWLEQPLTVDEDEDEEKEVDDENAEEGEDGSGGNGSDNADGSSGECREPPPLTREDEEYWEGLRGSLYPMEYRLAMPESLSSSESGEKTHTTTNDNVSEEDVEVLFPLDPQDMEAEKACAHSSSSSAWSSSASSSSDSS